ncbi:apoptosis-antagonizing transcription factor [Desarmillaria tabescens]|uniref:Protein BFR2 n=1 Tax=Armillaria tabescens TaxID=1929756 RepID=A0AA39NKJ8_ARMTA|nr:apoptosis-antagonizing transcription factor [Desarmillaria tabescens]KAK0467300.1 apoptosis-antagonizing transcription factor [Desarmillaria tabescens]
MATTRLSLSQQIAQLEVTAPDFDPEDIQPAVEDDDVQDINPAAREHYLDVGPSSLRKQQDSILDPKYDSVRTSRKQLMEESSQDEDEGEEEDEEEESSVQGDDEDEVENEEPVHGGDDTFEKKNALPGSDNQKHTDQDDLSSTLKRGREQDRKKGAAVAQQLSIWNSLLNARIRLQKSVNAANRLPPPSDEGFVGDQNSLTNMLHEAALLSEDLFDLQQTMLNLESISPQPRKRRRLSSDDSLQEYEAYICEATKASSDAEHAYHRHALQILSKWSSKIQAVAPSVLLPSNRNAFSKNSENSKTVVQLIDENLADGNKMLARTQIWRGRAERLGRVLDGQNEEEQEHDPEIFDDTDLYQQLLRDVIDAEKNGADDWLVVQKQKKAKKKVDTKASKGRKIRYEVHEKLQNFMVPVTINGAWHDQQIDELFGSLLGVGFENALDRHREENGGIDLRHDAEGISESGFRVFG